MWQLSPVPGKRSSAQLYRHTETVVGSFGTCVHPVRILSAHRVNSLVASVLFGPASIPESSAARQRGHRFRKSVTAALENLLLEDTP